MNMKSKLGMHSEMECFMAIKWCASPVTNGTNRWYRTLTSVISCLFATALWKILRTQWEVTKRKIDNYLKSSHNTDLEWKDNSQSEERKHQNEKVRHDMSTELRDVCYFCPVQELHCIFCIMPWALPYMMVGNSMMCLLQCGTFLLWIFTEFVMTLFYQ